MTREFDVILSRDQLVCSVLGCLVIGGAFGLFLFTLVEGTLRAVNWIDGLMETKSDEETRSD